MRLPTLVVCSPVVDVIRREALGCPVETGGVLVGYWSDDRQVLLVTAAGAPGPNAVHEQARFRPDAEAQAALLRAQYHRYGVGYVGEWHKHPGHLDAPSGEDHAQLRRLLSDPTRPLDAVLACIVTCTERGLGLHPYLARCSAGRLEVTAVAWHDVAFRAEEDNVFEQWRPS